jgi:hypothetical protein
MKVIVRQELFKHKQYVVSLILDRSIIDCIVYDKIKISLIHRIKSYIVIDSDERMWLPSDKKLFDQEIFKRDSSPPTLYFAVR